ncbi:MAG TPA: RNA polymerase sigma factor, partial [Candidatus Saccharimonadales bacterium]|nr:RNA polymerase sigma factor [Candidatus Saccharimonadales bacterium]
MTSERLERLFDDHHQRLYRLARRLARGPEDARDLVQETYLRAARRIDAVPAGAPSEEAWLVRVLVNLCRDRDRRIRVRSRAALRPSPGGSVQPSPEPRVVARDAVAKALAKLSPRRRAVVILRLVEEEPV